MPITYIALLRGINVSGRNIVNMSDLRTMMASSGFPDSRTYIQSGNIVFSSRGFNIDTVSEILASAIASRFGFSVPVIVLNYRQLVSAFEQCPFSDDGYSKPVGVYISFMSDVPGHIENQKIADSASPDEQWAVKDRFLYLSCPSGYGRTKLTNDLVEKCCGVHATTRNIRTVKKLISIAEEAGGLPASDYR